MARFLSVLWLLISLSLAIWSVKLVLHSHRPSVVSSAYIGLAFFSIIALGAILAFLKRKSGFIMLKIISIVMFLYTLTFFLFGGMHDRGLIYMMGVVLLFCLAIVTFFKISPKR